MTDLASSSPRPRAGAVARRALALGGGFLVALSMPPWGFWPLAFVGIALFEVSLGADRRPGARWWRGVLFGFAWLAMGMGWMWQLTVPGLHRRRRDLRRVPRRRRARRADRPLARDRPPGRAHARRGGPLLVPVRRRAAGQPRHQPGRRAAGRRRPRRRRDPAHVGRASSSASPLGAMLEDVPRPRRVAGARRAPPPRRRSLCCRVIAPRGHDTGRTLDVAAVQGGGEQGTQRTRGAEPAS